MGCPLRFSRPPPSHECHHPLRPPILHVQLAFILIPPRVRPSVVGILPRGGVLLGPAALEEVHLIHGHPRPLPVPKQDLILHVVGDEGLIPPRAKTGVGVHPQEAEHLPCLDAQFERPLDGVPGDPEEDDVGHADEARHVAEQPQHGHVQFRRGVSDELEVGLNDDGEVGAGGDRRRESRLERAGGRRGRLLAGLVGRLGQTSDYEVDRHPCGVEGCHAPDLANVQ
mmetsp:Transcript_18497/g.53338  ORF Transcript_18497/g.53338 Transcript_18497/m.53338 type:complete len:226 (+) Transcript_18497:323-1000(+)